MRRILPISILLLLCAATAAAVLAPDAAGRLRQVLSPGDVPAKAVHQPAPAVAVTTATATTADFPIRRYAIGFVSSPAVVEVNARVASQIVSIAAKDGQMVAAGDVLFKLDDRALQAAADRDQATLAKDQAMLISAQADLERARDLAADKAGTQQAYDQALAAEKAAAATVAADRAALDADQVQLGFATITAPIAGRLGVVNVTVGDLVGSGGNGGASGSVGGSGGAAAPTPLVTITQMDPLQVAFSLPETELDLLRRGLASASPPTVTLHRDGDPKPLGSGRLDFIDSAIDTASGTIAVKATLPNPGLSLWPGQYADIVVDAGTMPAMVSVPTVALQVGQAGPFVYVVGPDETVAVRQVKVAVNQGEASGISGGLTAGERVVVEGQVRLTEGTKVREQAASGAAPRGQGGATVAEGESWPETQPAGAAKTP